MKTMSAILREASEAMRRRIYSGETDLIAALTPEMFFAMMANYYQDGFAAGKDSTKKEYLCLLAASGMSVGEIAVILNIPSEEVERIMEIKKAHIEKCAQKLERRRSR